MNMREFDVQGIGGEIVTIMGPDDATQEQAQAQYDAYLAQNAANRQTQEALSNYGRHRVEQAHENLNPAHKFIRGAGNSVVETMEGIRQIGGWESPEWLEEASYLAENTPYNDVATGVGYLTGEVGQVMPATMAARGLGAGAASAEIGASALQQALKPVPEGQDPWATRAANAALGAAGGVVGRVPGFEGVKPIPAARSLEIRADLEGLPMRLTPGQRGGRVLSGFEQSLEAIPIIGGKVRELQGQGLQDWNRLVLNEVAPRGGIEATGTAGLKQVRNQFRAGYDKVMEGAPGKIHASDDAMEKLYESSTAMAGRMVPEAEAAYLKQVERIEGMLGKSGLDKDNFKLVKGDLDDLAEGAFRNGDMLLGKAYKDLSGFVSDAFKANLDEVGRRALTNLDEAYGKFLTVVRAQGYKGSVKDDLFTPEHLLSAVRAEDTSLHKVRFATGDAPMEQAAMTAQESMGRHIPAMGPGTAEKIIGTGGVTAGLLDPTMGIGGLAALWGASKVTPAMARFINEGVPNAQAYKEAMAKVPGLSSQVGEAVVSRVVGTAEASDDPIGARPRQVADEALTWIIQKAEDMGALRLAREARLAQRRGTPEEYQRIRKMLGNAIKESVRSGNMELANDLSASYQALNVQPLDE